MISTLYHMMQRLHPTQAPTPRAIHAKVVILGESSVGKTSVVVRGVRDEFFEFSEPTIGAAFLTTSRVVKTVQVKLELWDTAGQERYRSLAPMYYRGASVAMVVYDITRPESLVRAREWLAELRTRIPGDKCAMVLVGNKCDLGEMNKHMAVALEDIVHEYSVDGAEPLKHVLVSSKTGVGVEELFVHVCETVHSTGGIGDTRPDNGFILGGVGDGPNNQENKSGYFNAARGMCGV